MAEDYTFFDEDTSVYGELTTSKLIIEGSVKGKIVAKENVLIKKQGRVDAKVITGKLMVEEGADYKGSFILSDYSKNLAIPSFIGYILTHINLNP